MNNTRVGLLCNMCSVHFYLLTVNNVAPADMLVSAENLFALYEATHCLCKRLAASVYHAHMVICNDVASIVQTRNARLRRMLAWHASAPKRDHSVLQEAHAPSNVAQGTRRTGTTRCTLPRTTCASDGGCVTETRTNNVVCDKVATSNMRPEHLSHATSWCGDCRQAIPRESSAPRKMALYAQGACCVASTM